MADKFRIITGSSTFVEMEVNRFLSTLQGSYTRMMMSGDKDNLVVGIVYTEKKEEKCIHW